MKENSVLVVFGRELTEKEEHTLRREGGYHTVISSQILKEKIKHLGEHFIALEELLQAGSIYKASALVEELSLLTLPSGVLVSKSFVYKGYELWWLNYNSIFLSFCLPFTQYEKLLGCIGDFKEVHLFRPSYKSLFACYLEAHGSTMHVINKPGLRSPVALPFGVLFQIILTFLFLPFLILKRSPVLVFTGDKFEKNTDHDFRLKFIYQELRSRNIPFMEVIRSLESWKTVLTHALFRKRPVVYSEGMITLARLISRFTGGHKAARRLYGQNIFPHGASPAQKFKLLVATRHLLGVYDDVWAIRIMKNTLKMIGVKAVYITTVLERNAHTFIGSKLNGLPTVGILHGVASKYYNTYEFLPQYTGEKRLSVDKYGLWSAWWKEYFLKNSKNYTEDQLYISGLMRPLMKDDVPPSYPSPVEAQTRVLFVSEQLAVPEEVVPYLETLLNMPDVSLHISFRPYRDGFEMWLKQNRPDLLSKIPENHVLRSGIADAVRRCDMVVGTMSTAVIEALFQLKPIAFFATQKWGDYFELKTYPSPYAFYAETTDEFMEVVRNGKKIPETVLRDLLHRFFGDPYQNGSSWVVDQLETMIKK